MNDPHPSNRLIANHLRVLAEEVESDEKPIVRFDIRAISDLAGSDLSFRVRHEHYRESVPEVPVDWPDDIATGEAPRARLDGGLCQSRQRGKVPVEAPRGRPPRRCRSSARSGRHGDRRQPRRRVRAIRGGAGAADGPLRAGRDGAARRASGASSCPTSCTASPTRWRARSTGKLLERVDVRVELVEVNGEVGIGRSVQGQASSRRHHRRRLPC